MELIYVPLPDEMRRYEILKDYLKKWDFTTGSVDTNDTQLLLKSVASDLRNFSPSDLRKFVGKLSVRKISEMVKAEVWTHDDAAADLRGDAVYRPGRGQTELNHSYATMKMKRFTLLPKRINKEDMLNVAKVIHASVSDAEKRKYDIFYEFSRKNVEIATIMDMLSA